MGKLRESGGGWLSPHALTLKRGRLWCPDPVGLRAPLEQHTGCGGGADRGRESARGLRLSWKTLSS